MESKGNSDNNLKLDLTTLREDLRVRVFEAWKGPRKTGIPAPPYHKGKGQPKSHYPRPGKFWHGKGDVLDVNSAGYKKLTPEQKISVLKFGNKAYDVFKTGGYKHYVKKGDLPTRGKNLKQIKSINAEIGKAEGYAAGRAEKFFSSYDNYRKGKTKKIEIKRSDGKVEKLTSKEGEHWYRTNVVFQRYKAALLKGEMKRMGVRRRKKKEALKTFTKIKEDIKQKVLEAWPSGKSRPSRLPSLPYRKADGLGVTRELHKVFIKSRAKVADEYQHNLTPYMATEFKKAKIKTFLNKDKTAGYALKPDGELVNVFSIKKGNGAGVVVDAIKRGAKKLDCFDGALPKYYKRFGFKEIQREPNWTKGQPDIIYMRRKRK